MQKISRDTCSWLLCVCMCVYMCLCLRGDIWKFSFVWHTTLRYFLMMRHNIMLIVVVKEGRWPTDTLHVLATSIHNFSNCVTNWWWQYQHVTTGLPSFKNMTGLCRPRAETNGLVWWQNFLCHSMWHSCILRAAPVRHMSYTWVTSTSHVTTCGIPVFHIFLIMWDTCRPHVKIWHVSYRCCT